MSLVDRWLSRSPYVTPVKIAAPPSPLASQPVAKGLRHEKPQNSANFVPMSQKSQKSQKSQASVLADTSVTPSTVRAEPTLISPASWFEHVIAPEVNEPPYDKACPERRGRVERAGAVFLHFCSVCGAWGSFGYGVTGDRPGRWYCGKHQPDGDQHPVCREVAADEPR